MVRSLSIRRLDGRAYELISVGQVAERLERIRLKARRETTSTLHIHPRWPPIVSHVFPVVENVVSLVSKPTSFFATVLYLGVAKTMTETQR